MERGGMATDYHRSSGDIPSRRASVHGKSRKKLVKGRGARMAGCGSVGLSQPVHEKAPPFHILSHHRRT
ncbi:hypothetical protein HI914_00126 [Erysiphe necator]|nr:hypothetical protein HI914_00126 [Erysiphe necator]